MTSPSGSHFGFTCLSCRVTFPDASLQREHYKSEWHRYNLKRKVAGLPPVTMDVFEKIEAQHNVIAGANNGMIIDGKEPSGGAEASSLYCQFCRKKFSTEKAMNQHNESKKHQECVEMNEIAKLSGEDRTKTKRKSETLEAPLATKDEEAIVEDDDDGDWESVASGDEYESSGVAIPCNECLFCNVKSTNLQDNMNHMSLKHSFFIPDIEYVTDLEGLVEYLGEKVGIGFRCLWCCDSGKRFRSALSAKQHMENKGHSKMLYESGEALLEYSDYYDYSASYPAEEGDAMEQDKDEEISLPIIDDDDWQLTLPSGAVVGHRSLFRYYKQNLKPVKDEPRSRSARSALLNKVMSQYRALGWTGTVGEAAVRKAKDIRYMQALDRKRYMKLGMKHNNVLQPHFRHQIMF